MFGLIKRLLGIGTRKPTLPPPPPSPQSDATVPSAPKKPPAQPSASLKREEIIDVKMRIAGYRFTPRLLEDGTQPDSLTVWSMLQGENLPVLAERRKAMIAISWHDWLEQDYRSLIGPNTLFLITPPKLREDYEALGEVLRMIQRSGAKVALAGQGQPDWNALALEEVDFLLLHFADYSLPGFEKTVAQLKSSYPKLQLVADGLLKWSEFRYCTSLGIPYCIGCFSTEKDDEATSNEIGQSQLVLIEMLNRLRQDADLETLAEIAKRDPGVVIKFVAMANSPLVGLRTPVQSIDQAILTLGRNQLYRWLTISLFQAGDNIARDAVLLEKALARGRFLELLAQKNCPKAFCDELFLLGLLSLLDILLSTPMAQLAERLSLSKDFKDVLLHSDGPLAPYLMLAIAVERDEMPRILRWSEKIGSSIDVVEEAAALAMAWTQQAIGPGSH